MRRPSSSDETDTTVSRDTKYSAYKDVNYAVVLETKNSYMRSSSAGIVDEDRMLCDRFLREDQPIPQGSLFDDDRFKEFCSHLQDRSEARIHLDLHPLLVPSAENLFIYGQRNLEYLIDGYNDRWVKAIPFYGSSPQPDHTVGYRWSAFTELQRRKLDIDPTSKSYYQAREDIYFPFLTSEIKGGKSALDLADRANINSMTIAVRGVVELFRKAGRLIELHRRIIAFSISHDHRSVRLYAHYPEIDGDKTSFYRHDIKSFDYKEEKWTCYTFTRNIYEKFVPIHLEMIKRVIDQLPDPVEESVESAIAVDEESMLSLQEIASSAPEGEFRKPRQPAHAELRTLIQGLQLQLEQQRKETEQQRKETAQRETTLMAQLEQQRKETEQQRKETAQRETTLMAQLEQQRKETEQQRKETAQRETTLMAQLEQQRKETAQRETTLTAQLEQQRKETAQRETTLMAQLEQQRKETEQQRKETEQQRKETEQQRKELMQLVQQQSEQLNQLSKR